MNTFEEFKEICKPIKTVLIGLQIKDITCKKNNDLISKIYFRDFKISIIYDDYIIIKIYYKNTLVENVKLNFDETIKINYYFINQINNIHEKNIKEWKNLNK